MRYGPAIVIFLPPIRHPHRFIPHPIRHPHRYIPPHPPECRARQVDKAATRRIMRVRGPVKLISDRHCRYYESYVYGLTKFRGFSSWIAGVSRRGAFIRECTFDRQIETERKTLKMFSFRGFLDSDLSSVRERLRLPAISLRFSNAFLFLKSIYGSGCGIDTSVIFLTFCFRFVNS